MTQKFWNCYNISVAQEKQTVLSCQNYAIKQLNRIFFKKSEILKRMQLFILIKKYIVMIQKSVALHSQILVPQNINIAEMNYILYQDLDNFLGILFETQCCLQLFNEQSDFCKIQKNRLICQYNLSNSIQYDTKLNCEKAGIIYQFKETTNFIANWIKNTMKEKKKIKSDLQVIVQSMTNSLTSGQLKQIDLDQTIIQARQDDLEVICTMILSSMETVAEKFKQAALGNLRNLTPEECFRRAELRAQEATELIQSLFKAQSLNVATVQIIDILLKVAENRDHLSNLNHYLGNLKNNPQLGKIVAELVAIQGYHLKGEKLKQYFRIILEQLKSGRGQTCSLEPDDLNFDLDVLIKIKQDRAIAFFDGQKAI